MTGPQPPAGTVDGGIADGGMADGAGDVLARILAQQTVHGRLLHTIVELLTAEPDNDAPSLSKLLEVLIARIGDQTTAVHSLTVAVRKLATDLPQDLVAAIDDNLDIPQRTRNGQGGAPSS